MSNSPEPASRRTIGLLVLFVVITAIAVAVVVAQTSPLATAVTVILWIGAVIVWGAWMTHELLAISEKDRKQAERQAEQDRLHRERMCEEARLHREELNSRLEGGLRQWVRELLDEGGLQVEAVEALDRVLFAAVEKAASGPGDELAPRRAAR